MLTISSGGQVLAARDGGASAYAAILGGETNTNGMATIDGSGSLWQVADSMRIGADGTGSVTIQNGGKLEVDGATLEIGSLAGGTGTLTLNGSGSTVALPNGALIVGSAGNGTVTLQNGATLDQSNKTLVLGSQSTGYGKIQVQSGSTFNVANLTLGGAGAGELDLGSIGDDGSVTTGTANITGRTIVIGSARDSFGELHIIGKSTLIFSGTLQDGVSGLGNITLESGASLSTATLTLGANTGGSGDLDVRPGSNFTSTGDVNLGGAGQGNLYVDSGGTATIGGDLVMGENFGSTGSTISLSSDSGGASKLMVTGNLVVGQADQTGDTDTVTVSSGSQLGIGKNLTLGGALTAGTLNISGSGTGSGGGTSVQYGGVLNVGATSSVIITGGGVLSHSAGGGTDTDSGYIHVQGAGSDWKPSATVAITDDGSLYLDGGAHTEIGTLNIDMDSAGDGSASVDGMGGGTPSLLTVSNAINIDNGGGLTVSGGGQLNASSVANINFGATDGASTIKVTGANSVFNAPKANLNIAAGGTANLSVLAGGNMTVGNIAVGENASITVDGSDSTLTAQNLSDNNGGNGTIAVTNSGELILATVKVPDLKSFTVNDGILMVNSGDLDLLSDFSATNGSFVYASGALEDSAAGSTINLTDSTLSVSNVELNEASVTLNVTNSVLNAGGELNLIGGGTVNIDSASTVIGLKTIIDGGTINLSDSVAVDGVLLRSGLIDLGSQGMLTVGNYTSAGASFGSQLFVAAGGDLSGTGTIKATSFKNGGMLHIGDDPGTINIVGNYTQLPTGTLEIEVGPTSVSQLNVTGTATLAGTLALDAVDGATIRLGQTYNVLNATGGITGAFSTFDSGSPFITLIPQLNGGGLDFTTAHTPNSFADIAQTANQTEVATALDASANTATGNFANGITALSNASPNAVRASFDSVSGEAYADLATVAIDQSRGFSSAMLDRLNAVANGAGDSVGIVLSGDGSNLAVTPGAARTQPATGLPDKRYAVWAEGTGNFAENTGGAYGSHSFNTTAEGMAAGVDAAITPNWVAGAAFGYTHGSLNADALQSSADIDDYDVALYSGISFGRIFIRGAAGYVNGNATVTRGLNVAGSLSQTSGKPGSQEMFGAVETGEDFPITPSLVATPFARLDAARYWQNSVTESSGAFALNGAGQQINSAQTTLGSSFAKTFLIYPNAPIELTGSLGWAHEFAETARPIAAAFTGAPGQSFTVNGAPLNRNSAVISTGLNIVSGPADIYLRFDGQYGALDVSSAITGGVVFSW